MPPRLGTRLVLPGSHGVNLYLAYNVKSGTALAVPTVPVPAVPVPPALPIALEDRFCGSKKGGMEWGGGGGYKLPAVERPWLTLARLFLSSKAQSAIEITPLPF